MPHAARATRCQLSGLVERLQPTRRHAVEKNFLADANNAQVTLFRRFKESFLNDTIKQHYLSPREQYLLRVSHLSLNTGRTARRRIRPRQGDR